MKDEVLINDSDKIKIDDKIKIKLYKGEITAIVKEKK
jgi:hypothetical protein